MLTVSCKKNPNLMPCEACNEKISKRSILCPNCGEPTTPEDAFYQSGPTIKPLDNNPDPFGEDNN